MVDINPSLPPLQRGGVFSFYRCLSVFPSASSGQASVVNPTLSCDPVKTNPTCILPLVMGGIISVRPARSGLWALCPLGCRLFGISGIDAADVDFAHEDLEGGGTVQQDGEILQSVLVEVGADDGARLASHRIIEMRKDKRSVAPPLQ